MWTAILVLLTIGCLLFIAAGVLTLCAATQVSRFLDREFKRAEAEIEKGQRKVLDRLIASPFMEKARGRPAAN